LLKALPASSGQLGTLEQLAFAWLGVLEEIPDTLVRL
jgi:hypothetical protein